MFIHHYNLKHEVLTVLHHLIDEVGEQELSVDEGYSRLIKLIFGTDNFLPLDPKSKLQWLYTIAEITYSVNHMDYCCDEEIDFYYDLLMERCYTGGY